MGRMARIGTVWDRTAEFLSDNLPALLPVALLAFFVPASIEGNFEAARTDAEPGFALTLYLVQFAFSILSVWGSLTVAAMALDMADGRSAGAIGRARLLPALAVSVAMLAALLLCALPIPFALHLGGYDLTEIARSGTASLTPGLAGGIALYALAVLALLLWLCARLFVVNPVIVREQRMFSALARSWALTRGMAWRIIGVMLLFGLVSLVAILAAKTVFGSIFALVAGGTGDGVTLAGVLTAIVVAAVQTGFTVLVPAFTAKLYLALTADAALREGVVLA